MYFFNYFQTLPRDFLKSYAKRSRSSRNYFPVALNFISSEYLFVIGNQFLKISAMFMVSFFILVCSTISLFSWRFWTIFVDSLSKFLIFFIGYQSFCGKALLKNRVSASFLSICFLSFFLSICFLSIFLYLSILADFVVFLMIYVLQIFSYLNFIFSLGERLLAEVVKPIRK